MKEKIILLVEDSPQDEALTIRALKKAHVMNDVVVVRDGAEALDYLFCRGAYSSRDPQEMPELVLLDLKLPKVDGLEVLRQIRANKTTHRLCVVVLTTSAEEQDLVKSYDSGVNSYVRKPIDFSTFTASIEKLAVYWLLINVTPPY